MLLRIPTLPTCSGGLRVVGCGVVVPCPSPPGFVSHCFGWVRCSVCCCVALCVGACRFLCCAVAGVD